MKTLFISHCMEYEAGWGSKPDGIVLSNDLVSLENFIKPYNNRTNGSHAMFWDYSKPEEIHCSDEDFYKIEFKDNLKHLKSIKNLDIKFYKEM